MIGGPRFYERQEIRDATAYFDVTLNPANDLKFERIINTPKRGIGDRAEALGLVTAALKSLAVAERHPEVRTQLLCSAKRLPAEEPLPRNEYRAQFSPPATLSSR